MSKGFTDFRAALAERESSGNYNAVNSYGYLGAFQFGEAALVDLGLVNRDSNPYDNVFAAGFTGKFGVDSKAEFLNSVGAQNQAFGEWVTLLWSYIVHFDLDQYDGQVLNGVRMTQSGMVAAAHLLGVGGLRNFIEAGGVGGGSDAYGTQITEYIKTFAGYDLGLGRTTSWAHDNRFAGASGRDVFKGHGGNDVLIGAGGGDRLFGQSGADDLRGGGGRDWLFGGRGDDLLKGGSGRDVFVFSPNAGHDNVADFADGVDRIDLRRFHFADAAEALSHFFESGSASDGIAGFSLGDVSVTIHGVDRAGLDASDLIV